MLVKFKLGSASTIVIVLHVGSGSFDNIFGAEALPLCPLPAVWIIQVTLAASGKAVVSFDESLLRLIG